MLLGSVNNSQSHNRIRPISSPHFHIIFLSRNVTTEQNLTRNCTFLDFPWPAATKGVSFRNMFSNSVKRKFKGV